MTCKYLCFQCTCYHFMSWEAVSDSHCRNPQKTSLSGQGMVKVEYFLTKYSSIGECALKLPEQTWTKANYISITRLHSLALSGLRAPSPDPMGGARGVGTRLRAPLGKRVESAWERPLICREFLSGANFYLAHTFWTYSRVRVYRHTSSRCSLEGIDLLVFCVPWSC